MRLFRRRVGTITGTEYFYALPQDALDDGMVDLDAMASDHSRSICRVCSVEVGQLTTSKKQRWVGGMYTVQMHLEIIK